MSYILGVIFSLVEVRKCHLKSRSNTEESGFYLCITIFAGFLLKLGVQANSCKGCIFPFHSLYKCAQVHVQTHCKAGLEVF